MKTYNSIPLPCPSLPSLGVELWHRARSLGGHWAFSAPHDPSILTPRALERAGLQFSGILSVERFEIWDRLAATLVPTRRGAHFLLVGLVQSWQAEGRWDRWSVKGKRNGPMTSTWQWSLEVLFGALCSMFESYGAIMYMSTTVSFGHKTFPFTKHRGRIYNLESKSTIRIC